MPDGSPAGKKGTVVVLSAEDGIADTIRPRLDAAGADVSRVCVFDEVAVRDGPPRPVELPLDLPLLGDIIRAHDAVLVTIDPLMAFLSGVDSHSDQSIRRALHPLSKLAEQTGAAVAVIRHLNKGSGSKALYRGGGSIGIAGAARAVHVVAADPADESGQLRLLAPVKVNIAVRPATMAYRLISDELHGCARVSWEGTVTATADDLVNVELPEERKERVTATDFLKTALADGARRSKDVEEEAREAYGISPRTLTNARRHLGILATKTKEGWWIELPPVDSAESKNEEQDRKGATPSVLPSCGLDAADGTQPDKQETRAEGHSAVPSEWPPGTLPSTTDPRQQEVTGWPADSTGAELHEKNGHDLDQ
jgi:hypothetical protein